MSIIFDHYIATSYYLIIFKKYHDVKKYIYAVFALFIFLTKDEIFVCTSQYARNTHDSRTKDTRKSMISHHCKLIHRAKVVD